MTDCVTSDRVAVPDQPGDVLHRNAGVREQRGKAVPHLAGRPLFRVQNGGDGGEEEPGDGRHGGVPALVRVASDRDGYEQDERERGGDGGGDGLLQDM